MGISYTSGYVVRLNPALEAKNPLSLVLLIGLAGALGSVSRYLFSRSVLSAVGGHWLPAGTMAVNVIGSFAIGLLGGLAASRGFLSPSTRMVLTTGFLGGFTTFSTFSFETLTLVRQGEPLAAAANVALQVGLGLAAVFFGYFLGERF